MRAPPQVQDLIKTFWEANKDKQIIEAWPEGNVYTNHWEGTYLSGLLRQYQ